LRFTTTSRVALVGNDWKTLDADVAALEDRGHVLLFEPTALEVHRQAASWFWHRVGQRVRSPIVPRGIVRASLDLVGLLLCRMRIL
jgi:hypothetical protein